MNNWLTPLVNMLKGQLIKYFCKNGSPDSNIVCLDTANGAAGGSPLRLVVREQHGLLELLIVELAQLVLLCILLHPPLLEFGFLCLLGVFLQAEASQAKLNARLTELPLAIRLVLRVDFLKFGVLDWCWSCPS